jgi:hypothetical protein
MNACLYMYMYVYVFVYIVCIFWCMKGHIHIQILIHIHVNKCIYTSVEDVSVGTECVDPAYVEPRFNWTGIAGSGCKVEKCSCSCTACTVAYLHRGHFNSSIFKLLVLVVWFLLSVDPLRVFSVLIGGFGGNLGLGGCYDDD